MIATVVASHSKTNILVYGALLLVGLGLVGWLIVEHHHVEDAQKQALLNRARDITNTVGILTRTGGPGIIRQDHLDQALNELTSTRELETILLVNADGEVVSEAGEPFRDELRTLPLEGIRWEDDRVLVINLVDFGRRTFDDGSTRPVTIVIPEPERMRERLRREDDTDTSPSRWRLEPPSPARNWPGPDFDREIDRRRDDDGRRPDWDDRDERDGRFDRDNRNGPDDGDRFERANFRRLFNRPFWMDPERYENLLAQRGLHGFVLVLSTSDMKATLARDTWLRVMLAGLAWLALLGVALVWRGRERATRLQLRLLRAQELNEHLRELNIAAAGLAHETRNPLNIVRGQAQLLAAASGVSTDFQRRAVMITDEVDQITQRLNEFIKYSKPMEPRLTVTSLENVVQEVIRALGSDLEDHNVTVNAVGSLPPILADEGLLRQVLFNLVLNAIQAVSEGGTIEITFDRTDKSEGVLSVHDDGPGVPDEAHDQIFRPYYTSHEKGTGLGLAVVRQIVLAHHWEIEYSRSKLGGACFKVRCIRVMESRMAGN